MTTKFDYLIGRTFKFRNTNNGKLFFEYEHIITKINKPFRCDLEWLKMECEGFEDRTREYDCYQCMCTEVENGVEKQYSCSCEIREYDDGEQIVIFYNGWDNSVTL